jgi:hypothetical protein
MYYGRRERITTANKEIFKYILQKRTTGVKKVQTDIVLYSKKSQQLKANFRKHTH